MFDLTNLAYNPGIIWFEKDLPISCHIKIARVSCKDLPLITTGLGAGKLVCSCTSRKLREYWTTATTHERPRELLAISKVHLSLAMRVLPVRCPISSMR